MMKPLLFGLASLALAACSPNAQTEPPSMVPWQDVLASDGLAAAEENLKTRPSTPETSFALGAVQFLRANEAIMQVRYENATAPLAILPGMRNRLPVNPEAHFDPAFLEVAMTDALTHLQRAEINLSEAVGQSFTVEIDMTRIWFDVNQNGARDTWESGLAMMADLGAEPNFEFDGLIRFDSADAHWLKAYTHVMSGMAELTLAVDPTSAIETVYNGRAKLDALGEIEGLFLDNETIDTLTTVLLTLRGVPDENRTRAAHQHFRDMISENRAFWAAVIEETDNDREWLPNPNQSSAFGVTISAEMAQGWQDVLVELEGLIEGETLIPYWRYGNAWDAETGVGVNLAKFLQNPGDMDIILWIHGAGATPYLETGQLARMRAWDRFTQMTRGDGLMFAAWLN